MALALELNYNTNTIHAGENNANQNQLNCASLSTAFIPLTISAQYENQTYTIGAGNYEIALFGKRSPDGSSPEMLWARPVSN